LVEDGDVRVSVRDDDPHADATIIAAAHIVARMVDEPKFRRRTALATVGTYLLRQRSRYRRRKSVG
jgi:hypothetical protein